MNKILIISKKEDAHIPFVSKYLNTEPIILDSFLNPKENLLTYKTNKGKIEIFYKNIYLNDVSGVWYRKPRPFRNADLGEYKLNDIQSEYSKACLNTTFSWLNDLLRDKLWISDYRSIIKAQNKLYQYELAYNLGFNVPDFVLTNNSFHALDFINAHKQEVVIKAVNTTQQLENDKTYYMYTKYIHYVLNIFIDF